MYDQINFYSALLLHYILHIPWPVLLCVMRIMGISDNGSILLGAQDNEKLFVGYSKAY